MGFLERKARVNLDAIRVFLLGIASYESQSEFFLEIHNNNKQTIFVFPEERERREREKEGGEREKEKKRGREKSSSVKLKNAPNFVFSEMVKIAPHWVISLSRHVIPRHPLSKVLRKTVKNSPKITETAGKQRGGFLFTIVVISSQTRMVRW